MGENFDKYYLPPDAQELIDAPQGATIPHKDGQGLPIGIKQEPSEIHPSSNPSSHPMHVPPHYVGAENMMGYPMQFEFPYNMEQARNSTLHYQEYNGPQAPHGVQVTDGGSHSHASIGRNYQGPISQVNPGMYGGQTLHGEMESQAGSHSPEHIQRMGHSRSPLKTGNYAPPQQMGPPPSEIPVHPTQGLSGPVLFSSELELKRLASEAAKLPLAELAARVKLIDNDDSESSKNLHSITLRDKHRDIFATAWLLGVCEVSSTAVVPRNRVYARYVQSCANFGLVPITPTNMGKLVKLMFPGLRIRRLGVRGRSKYHYNGIRLIEDPEESHRISPSAQLSPPDSPNSAYSMNSPAEGLDVAQARTPTSLVSAAAELLDILELCYVPDVFHQVDQLLEAEDMSTPVTLPSIYPYLPPDTDSDIADTLYALYTIHCTTVLECMRYLHTKRLFLSFSALNTILTAPVKTLYSSESVVPWIHKCDTLVYNKMAKMLTRVYLQLAPPMVLQRLKEVAENLLKHLADSLRNKMHKEFVDCKIKSALKFVSLLTRMIAVIQSRDIASRYLKNQEARRAMLESWLNVSIPDMVEHLVPCQDRTDFLSHVLVDEVQHILSNSSDVVGDCAALVSELPARFPGPNPRLYLVTAGSLLTACLIEIGLNGGVAKEAWYAVICWIDEFMNFCLELGGYFRNELGSSATLKPSFAEETNVDNDDNEDTERYESNASENVQTVDLLDRSFGTERDQNFEEMFYNVQDILHDSVLQ